MKNINFFKTDGKSRKIKLNEKIQELITFNVNHGLKKKPLPCQDELGIEKEEAHIGVKK